MSGLCLFIAAWPFIASFILPLFVSIVGSTSIVGFCSGSFPGVSTPFVLVDSAFVGVCSIAGEAGVIVDQIAVGVYSIAGETGVVVVDLGSYGHDL